jgi:hypothetical protein
VLTGFTNQPGSFSPWEVFHEIEHHVIISPFHKRDGAKMVESIDSSRIPPGDLDMLRPGNHPGAVAEHSYS